MRIIDLHSHWGTQKGYVFRSKEELAKQEKIWKSAVNYMTEREMADYFREQDVKVILDLGFTKFLPIEEVRVLHDYAMQVRKEYSDVILGNWIQINPKTGAEGVKELSRCLGSGFVGFAVSGAALGMPANDPIYDPYYRLCIEAGIPVLIFVGYTGAGAGLPGGKGMRLELCHPRYVDDVAARFPELTVVAGRPAWPWQAEMIAILLHKPNVWCELHGWSPKHFPADLKWDIPRRLRKKLMFGADYPLFRYERLVEDWKREAYDESTLERVFYKNAEDFFGRLKYKWNLD